MTKTTKIEFGDFQTPNSLAEAVSSAEATKRLSQIITGADLWPWKPLLRSVDEFKDLRHSLGAEINPKYVRAAQDRLGCRKTSRCAHIEQRDFFRTDWSKVFANMPEPILVLGNPPWVTSAGLGAIGGENLPVKSNFQNHNGLDAITGKANFDISEWMLLQLAHALNGRTGTLAMLCKSGVARKILLHAWKDHFAVEKSSVHLIDANGHFDAAVDASLLVIHFGQEGVRRRLRFTRR